MPPGLAIDPQTGAISGTLTGQSAGTYAVTVSASDGTNTGSATAAFQNWVLDVNGINTGDGLTGRHFNNLVQVTDPITGVGKDDFYNDDYAAFFEDSWHISPKLTLNMGLRWDMQHVPQPPQPKCTPAGQAP